MVFFVVFGWKEWSPVFRLRFGFTYCFALFVAVCSAITRCSCCTNPQHMLTGTGLLKDLQARFSIINRRQWVSTDGTGLARRENVAWRRTHIATLCYVHTSPYSQHAHIPSNYCRVSSCSKEKNCSGFSLDIAKKLHVSKTPAGRAPTPHCQKSHDLSATSWKGRTVHSKTCSP
jgi:hypothetical protein